MEKKNNNNNKCIFNNGNVRWDLFVIQVHSNIYALDMISSSVYTTCQTYMNGKYKILTSAMPMSHCSKLNREVIDLGFDGVLVWDFGRIDVAWYQQMFTFIIGHLYFHCIVFIGCVKNDKMFNILNVY